MLVETKKKKFLRLSMTKIFDLQRELNWCRSFNIFSGLFPLLCLNVLGMMLEVVFPFMLLSMLLAFKLSIWNFGYFCLFMCNVYNKIFLQSSIHIMSETFNLVVQTHTWTCFKIWPELWGSQSVVTDQRWRNL